MKNENTKDWLVCDHCGQKAPILTGYQNYFFCSILCQNLHEETHRMERKSPTPKNQFPKHPIDLLWERFYGAQQHDLDFEEEGYV